MLLFLVHFRVDLLWAVKRGNDVRCCSTSAAWFSIQPLRDVTMEGDATAARAAKAQQARARSRAKNRVIDNATKLLESIQNSLPGTVAQFYLYESANGSNGAGTYSLDSDMVVGLSPESMASLTEHNSDMADWVNLAAFTVATPEQVQITTNKAADMVCNKFLQPALRKVYAEALKALDPPKKIHVKKGMLHELAGVHRPSQADSIVPAHSCNSAQPHSRTQIAHQGVYAYVLIIHAARVYATYTIAF